MSIQRTEGAHPALKAFIDLRHNLNEAVRHLIHHFNKLNDNCYKRRNSNRLMHRIALSGTRPSRLVALHSRQSSLCQSRYRR